ncbi:DNA-directed RNA polymerase, mitochondrial [Diaphorina citri]|uniref:DNA-directed RNA polymerase n=1 Tax=Diaphorina citri TaxID=121845 RepID=A0A3Q0J297_DIACI|nr:DNA-directed RNA polymerase, mitochondrial [Diaphorina citri]
MIKMLQLCPLKIFSKRIYYSIPTGQPISFKSLKDSCSMLCEQRRKQSAKAAVMKLVLKKNKKNARTKSVEVLQVNDNSSQLIETQIRTLKSSQFHLVQSKESNSAANKCNNEDESNEMKDNEKQERLEEELETSPVIPEKKITQKVMNQAISNINRKSEESAKVKKLLMDKEKLIKETVLNETLLAYTDACVNCGLTGRGYTTLRHYLTPKRLKKARVINVNIFNTLLHAYAAEAKLDKVKEILDIVLHQHSDLLRPNIQTFAAVLECLGRKEVKPRYTEQIAGVIEQMKHYGFSINDLFIDCFFTRDQRRVVLSAVHRTHPDFVPHIPSPVLNYDCDLLTELDKNHAAWVSPADGVLDINTLQSGAQEQISTEAQGSVCVNSISCNHDVEGDERIEEYRKIFEETKDQWRRTIREAFNRDLSMIRTQHNKLKTYREVNMFSINKKRHSGILHKQVDLYEKYCEWFSINKKRHSGILHKQVELYEKYCEWYLDPQSSEPCPNTRHKWQLLLHQHPNGPNLNTPDVVWPTSVLSSVGKFLYNIIVKDLKININLLKSSKNCPERWLPAFYPLFRTGGRTMNEELKPHPVLTKLFRATLPPTLDFEVTHVPMTSPPLPWYCANKGGYIISQVPFIRLPLQAQQQLVKLQNMNQQQLYPALDSLNQLSSTPWVVNERILDVITEVFQNGGSDKLDIPLPASSFPLPPAVSRSMSQKERQEAFRERCTLKRQKSEMFSLWCDALYRLSLAHHFKGRVFWLPHNMDFRGRVYPCPPHLNHLGSDMARGILDIAVMLGSLPMLTPTLFSMIFWTRRTRRVHANSILNDILDSAQNPLSGRMWWADSENPWQTLACCMEIQAALDSDCPAEFLSGFPVHQDGSCNGLQHYAALGRDQAGAVSVNLVPAAVPQDVYSAVAALVERERSKDAANGLKIAQIMDGFVRRKVIKQTVMTTVYGVTRYGARLQIVKQLKDIESYPQEHVWSGSSYLMNKTFDCLREMFTSTREIQDWFTSCAKFISLVRARHVEWVTPLGLPVVQHYHKTSKSAQRTPSMMTVSRNMDGDLFNKPNMTKQKNAFPPNFVHSLDSTHMMLTSLHCEDAGITYVSVHDCFWTHPATVPIMNKSVADITIAKPSLECFSKPNMTKQKNAFPPNFVHSLDSTHMMLTSLHCEDAGITYVSVHDCFWTHPATVPIMNKICRQQFVNLHSQPILEDLSVQLINNYASSESELEASASNKERQMREKLNELLTKVPPKGDLDVRQVLNSVYFFS